MSRIGLKPVAIPGNVKVVVEGQKVTMEGPLGKLQMECRPEVSVKWDEPARQIVVSRASDERLAKSLHGLTRAMISNMVVGVVTGYEKKLEIIGVGYLGSIQGDILSLRLGFANEI